jgi:PAS domain S-box-containing protein
MKSKPTIDLRKTGISVVGDVPWGTHFCHFYETKEDLLDILIPFFKTGLENNEFCVWVVSNPLGIEEARNALRQAVPEADLYLARGHIEIVLPSFFLSSHQQTSPASRIEIIPDTEWYLESGAFVAERVINGWNEKLAVALEKGYAGLRANGSGAWLTEENRKDFNQYEKTVDEQLTGKRMIVLCSYPVSKSNGAEIFDVVNTHQLAVLRRRGNWEVLEAPELTQARYEIKRLNEELEERVVERTRELAAANEELRREITDRKQAEDALRKSEDHFRLLINTIPTMAWTLRADAVLDYVNQRWLDYTGLSFEEAIEDETRTVNPEDLSRVMEKWLVVKDTNEAYEDEMRLQRADGEYHWFLVRIEPLLDEQGNLLKRYGVAIDIEERKRAEEALDERLRFETLVTELSAAFANLATSELDREIDKWLQTLVEFLGVDRASFLQFGEDWTTLYRSHSYTVPGIDPLPSPIMLKDQFPWITDQLHQGKTVNWSRVPDDMHEEAVNEREYATRLGVKAGLNIPVMVGGSVICAITFTSIVNYRDWPDEMVARLRLVGEIFATVVERRRAEGLLHAKEQEFRAIVENAPDQIIRYDREFRRIYVNPAVAQFNGLPAEALIGKPLGSGIRAAELHVKEEEIAEVRRRIAAVFTTGKSCDYELAWTMPTGRKHLSIRLFPELDLNGSVVHVLGISRDITERKEAEDSLREALVEINKLKDQLYKENIALRAEIVNALMFEEIIGTSPALQEVLVLVAKVAPTDSTVLITGETGTGKELIARAIHKRSNRAGHVFMSVNCAAIPPGLIASELFGHEKGAFTGAVQLRLGRFELAEGGTIFLDEIGELPAETQISLLRILQEHEFQRVGGTKTIRADVRVIAATNRDLRAAIDAGVFRRDLFYRLNVFPIEMPLLRARREDIPQLVEYFIHRYASKMGKKIRRIDKKALDMLTASDWPGNIRELQNVIERSVILNETDTFTIDQRWLTHNSRHTQMGKALLDNLATHEREMIEAALAESRGQVSGPSGAAAKLGLPPSTLDSKIRALNINKYRFKTS